MIRKLPFLIYILALLSPLVFFLDRSIFHAYFVLISIYVLYKYMIFIIGTCYGLIRKNREKTILKDQSTYHLIVIASYLEGNNALEALIDSIVNQTYQKEKIFISISLENRAYETEYQIAEKIKNLKLKYKNFKGKIFITKHILKDSEVYGAASNRTNAAKFGVENIKKLKLPTSDFIVSAPDSDMILEENYLQNLTVKYLKTKNDKVFYQSSNYTFNNNFWKTRFFTRILSISLTQAILSASYLLNHRRETFSFFSIKLDYLIKADYWDCTLSIDDHPFYFRLFDKFKIIFENIRIDSEVSSNGIYHKSLIRNVVLQYKQYLRWGLGITIFPYALELLMNSKKLNLFQKTLRIFWLFEDMVLIRSSAIIITLNFLLLSWSSPSLRLLMYIENWVLIMTILTFIGYLTKLILMPKRLIYLPKFIILSMLDMVFAYPVQSFFNFVPYFQASFELAINQNNYSIEWFKE